MATKLYVGNLSYNASNTSLQTLFEPFGDVVSATIVTDRDTGRSKGFGFVEMGDSQSANAAIASLNGQEQDGRALTVNEARPKEPRTGGFAQGGSRGRSRY